MGCRNAIKKHKSVLQNAVDNARRLAKLEKKEACIYINKGVYEFGITEWVKANGHTPIRFYQA